MHDLISIVSDIGLTSVVLLVVAFFIAIRQIYETAVWTKNRLEDWRNKKNGIENHDKSIDDRVESLEKNFNEFSTSMAEKMDKLYDILLQQQADNDKVTVANSRATLNALADQIKQKGYMTETEYDTFMELSDIYLAKNGNHSMRDKVIPYIKSLPVKDS